ncbi:PRC-barrel domain-containing protein [Clostridiaceae bacterium 35-E11]
MIKRGSDIIGLPVICLNQGCKVTEVKDILYCNNALKVIGLLVEEGSYFHHVQIIAFESIKNIGEDAITIYDSNSIQNFEATNQDYYALQSREKILGTEVITDAGNDVGIVQDIMIEASTGKILGLSLANGLFDDLVAGRPILPLQGDIDLSQNTIVITQSLNHLIIHNTGGLKKLLSLE